MLLICILLVAVTLAAYSPVFRNGFINYDDDAYVTKNPHVKAGLTSVSLAWAFNVGFAGNWHPLTWMSHMLDYQLYGDKAADHHATSLILHLASTVLLFLIFRRMTGALWKSAFVAALFALHPLHVESVAWVAERKDVLSTLFWVLAMGAYVLYTERPSIGRYLAIALLFGLGLMAKPMLVTLPLVLLLLDYWPLDRVRRGWSLVREKIPLLAMSVGSGIITFIAQHRGGAVASLEEFPTGVRIANALAAYAGYVGKTIVPRHLAIFYPHPGSSMPVWQVIGSSVFLAGATILAVYYGRKRRYLLVGWLWYVITLIPVIGLVQVGRQAMADRYTYVPLIGIFIIAAMGLTELVGEKRNAGTGDLGATLPRLAALVLIPLAILAGRQVGYWRNSEVLFQHALDVTKNNYLAHINLGMALGDEGRFDEAISQFQESLKIKSNDDMAHFSLGGVLMDKGELDAAAAEFRTAIKITPTYAMAHYNLGLVFAMQGMRQPAMMEYRKALEINPSMAPAHNNLGAALASEGKVQEAIGHFRKAIRIEPNQAMAHFNLGTALLGQGKTDEAISEYRKSILSNPDYPNAYYNLGIALEKQGKPDEAAAEYRNALEVDSAFERAAMALQRVQGH